MNLHWIKKILKSYYKEHQGDIMEVNI